MRDPWAPRRRRAVAAAVMALVLAATACGADSGAGGAEDAVRLGFFPNVTHAPALVGLEEGIFQEALGDDVRLSTQTFNAGGEAVEAIFGGAIDLAFIGPNPAINAFAQSDGEAVRVIAGTTSGGAFFVTRQGVDGVEDLPGTRIGTPALGNTQDVALRAWAADQGFEVDPEGGGDFAIQPADNAEILEGFVQGAYDGAWVPEPWATRLVEEGDGQILVDERDLWPDGRYVTTHVLVSTRFLEAQPDLVRRFLEGLVDAIAVTNDDPERARAAVASQIEEITGVSISAAVLARAWENLEFTLDPIASSLVASAEDATEVGLLDPVDLDGIYDLTLLDEVLEGRDLEPVGAP